MQFWAEVGDLENMAYKNRKKQKKANREYRETHKAEIKIAPAQSPAEKQPGED